MVRTSSEVEVVYDTLHPRRAGSRRSHSEWRNFMSSNLADMYTKASSSRSAENSDSEDDELDMKKILKDIEYLGSSNMSWKEKKQLENQRVVSLGGKPPKKHRLPLSVAKAPMKKQKLREQEKLEEDLFLGRFQKKQTDRRREKRKPVAGALMSGEGYFKKGVLNVKHLLGSSQPKNDAQTRVGSSRKKKGKGKKRGKKRKH